MSDEKQQGEQDAPQPAAKKANKAVPVVSDVRVSFIGKSANGKPKHVAFHVSDVEKALEAISGDKGLSSLSEDIEHLASVGADLLEQYDDAHKVEVDQDGLHDGSKKYPFAAAAAE